MVAAIIAYTINILIMFHNLPLDVEEDPTMDENRANVNKVVLEFLLNYLGLLPNEVAKNWNKFQQYFDVFYFSLFRIYLI